MIDFTHPILGEEELVAVQRVIRSSQLAQGHEVSQFEAEFADATGAAHSVAVSNGTTAIEIGLQSLGIGVGDEVVVPSFTFIATANAVRRVGATPVFADIDAKTYCITSSTVEPLIGPRTRAVLAVHLYGHPANMDALVVLCETSGVHLLEDAAQGIGSRWRGQSVGTFGTLAAFSLYATKNITTGEGGMITTRDAQLADHARALRSHQSRVVEDKLQIASNSRMTDLEAAIGRVQLGRLPGLQERRQRLARVYDAELHDSVTTPYVADEATHGYHQYTVRVEDRASVIATMRSEGVGYGIYYPTPVHLTETYRNPAISLPDTEAAAEEVLSLPIRPDLTDREQERVTVAVNRGAGR